MYDGATCLKVRAALATLRRDGSAAVESIVEAPPD
jgi:hypothetical protein